MQLFNVEVSNITGSKKNIKVAVFLQPIKNALEWAKLLKGHDRVDIIESPEKKPYTEDNPFTLCK